ncbi:hypothetical protein SAMN05660313_02077 [Cellulophaga fucicola]|uniref:Uncharacterized protein n=1 Tax=Cellulophaga fucicola TaxID=76595 RepID=A0A1K1PP35_9FLAO|nr:hypothetical protein SAMN05660313_02077 [Cellulophaga fucicola]
MLITLIALKHYILLGYFQYLLAITKLKAVFTIIKKMVFLLFKPRIDEV